MNEKKFINFFLVMIMICDFSFRFLKLIYFSALTLLVNQFVATGVTGVMEVYECTALTLDVDCLFDFFLLIVAYK